MKALKVGEGDKAQTLTCVHWKTFPPAGSAPGEDIEELRTSKVITDEQYNRFLIWKRDCGLKEMSPSKCPTCPHRRKVVWKTQGPVLVDLHGVETPVVDMATGEAAPRNRHLHGLFQKPGSKGSHQTAAWVPDGEGGNG